MPGYITGFCSNGLHEGLKPVSRSGQPMKVCVNIEQCTCDCHKKITDMFKMANAKREVIDNPDYVPYESGIQDFLAQYNTERKRATVEAIDYDEPVALESGAIVPGIARSGKNFQPTKRGRAAGQLEDQVRDICNRFLQREFPNQENCTPRFISETIQMETGADSPPSTGAIGAVFNRWKNYEYAIIGERPVHFQIFTARGLTEGLAVLKAEYEAKNRK